MLTTKDYHSIHILDDPSINNNGNNNNNNNTGSNNNNGSSNSNKNPNSNNNVTPTGSNNGSGNTNGNGIPTSSIQSVLKKKNNMPDILIDYQQLAKDKKIHHVSFRDRIINKLLTILTTKNHPNALLVGEAGTGKTAIVEDLAVRLYENEPITTAMLGKETHIYELPLSNLVAGSSMVGALEAKLQQVIDFISDEKNHAILYLDEIHQLTTSQSLKGVAEILKPALARGDMHVIGSTTTQELKFWQRNPALTRRFTNLIIPELSNDETIEILKKVLPQLQNKQSPVQFDNKYFKDIVNIGNRYARTLATHRPDSAITILDQSLSLARLQALQLSQQAMKAKPIVNLNVIEQAGRQLINNDDDQINNHTVDELKKQLDKNIVGQTEAKQVILDAIKSITMDLIPQDKPHSFLFAGLSGTGKTEVAKQTAKVLFGSMKSFIYLNMTEYASNASLTRLIGSSRGYVGSDSAQPLPLDGLKSNPFQIVLLDEFEKAAPDVQRIFMQALDEGEIQYNDGSTVDFSHAIVIATTNAGTSKLDAPVIGFDPATHINHNELSKVLTESFPPELLNRFEYVVSFDRITKNEYRNVLAIKYRQLRHTIMTHRPEYKIIPEDVDANTEFIKELADQSYDEMKNARPAERTIRHFLENAFLNKKQGYTIDLIKSDQKPDEKQDPEDTEK